MSRGAVAVVAALGALLLALTAVYAPALASMRAMWDATPMYSFGYAVPFVSAYLIWTRRAALAAVPTAPNILAGAAAFALAAGLVLIGRLASIQLAEQLSFVIALVAAVLLVWGWPTVRTIWVALAYLLLIVPFWDGLTERLHAPFQRLSARVGVGLLQAAGIPVFQDGNFLYLPNLTLEVARACSGVNYLVAILALGIPLVYVSLTSNRRRVLLIASAIAVAALSNGLRVALIGILAYAEVGTPLHGPAHVLHGLFVSGIGYVVLLAGVRWLAPRHAEEVTAAPAVRGALDVPIRHAIAAACLFAGLWGLLTVYRPVPRPLPQPLATLPAVLGSWQAVTASPPSKTWWHDADDSLHRVYASPTGHQVEVAIAYFATQAQGREAASHLSAPLDRAVTSTVALAAGPGEAAPLVNAIRLPAGGDRRRSGVFWYEIGGRILTSPSEAKLRTALSVLTTRRSAALLVVVLDVDPTAPAGSPTAGSGAAGLAAEIRAALARQSLRSAS